MPTLPLYLSPLYMLPRPAGELALTLRAPEPATGGMVPVYAPEAATVVYVGPGNEAPWDGNGPGVIVLMGDRTTPTGPAYLHVLGRLDGLALQTLWRLTAGEWGYTEAKTDQGILEGGLVSKWMGGDKVPRPKVAAGDVVGYVSPTLGELRWRTWLAGSTWAALWDDVILERMRAKGIGPALEEAMDAREWEEIDPLRWLADVGLRAPQVWTPAAPASSPAPVQPAAPASTSGSSALPWLLAGGAVGLYLLATRRTRRTTTTTTRTRTKRRKVTR